LGYYMHGYLPFSCSQQLFDLPYSFSLIESGK
jgi:hypothetical protein